MIPRCERRRFKRHPFYLYDYSISEKQSKAFLINLHERKFNFIARSEAILDSALFKAEGIVIGSVQMTEHHLVYPVFFEQLGKQRVLPLDGAGRIVHKRDQNITSSRTFSAA